MTTVEAATDSACEGRGSLPRANIPAETQAISAQSRARIEGRSLKVGRFTFAAAAADPEEYGFRYVGRFSVAPVDILLEQSFDSIGWTIADQETGKKLETPSLPIPSPDGRYWAVSWPFTPPDGKIEIYERAPTGWRRLASFKMGETCDLKWSGPGVLTFRDNTGLPFLKGMGPERRISLSASGWRLSAKPA